MMNEPQLQSLLQAIAISSGLTPNPTPTSRQTAFSSLEQFKSYPARIGGCIELISRQSLILNDGSGAGVVDCTVPAKLFCLGVIQEFLSKDYNGLEEGERGALRGSVLGCARQLVESAQQNGGSNEATLRILSMKIASLLADLAVREFPQRWNSFVSDLFAPGGIWGEDVSGANNSVGVKICLECLKLITEDCTDSDFNSKVSAVVDPVMMINI